MFHENEFIACVLFHINSEAQYQKLHVISSIALQFGIIIIPMILLNLIPLGPQCIFDTSRCFLSLLFLARFDFSS